MIALVAASQVDLINRIFLKTRLRDSVFDRREQMRTLLTANRTWNQIIQANPRMACLNSGPSCAPGAIHNFSVVENSDTGPVVLANPQQPGLGFDTEGRACTTFNDPTSRSCVFRVAALAWTAECGIGTTCLDPQIRISGRIEIKDFQSPNGHSQMMSTADQVFAFYRPRDAARLSEVLRSETLRSIGSCPPGQFLAGFNRDGTKLCID